MYNNFIYMRAGVKTHPHTHSVIHKYSDCGYRRSR